MWRVRVLSGVCKATRLGPIRHEHKFYSLAVLHVGGAVRLERAAVFESDMHKVLARVEEPMR